MISAERSTSGGGDEGGPTKVALCVGLREEFLLESL
jgi:hypothetical protein